LKSGSGKAFMKKRFIWLVALICRCIHEGSPFLLWYPPSKGSPQAIPLSTLSPAGALAKAGFLFYNRVHFPVRLVSADTVPQENSLHFMVISLFSHL
jgi:hypothetical protein